jgi:hypothetical protein
VPPQAFPRPSENWGKHLIVENQSRALIARVGGFPKEEKMNTAYLYGFNEEFSAWTLNQTNAPADGQAGDLFGLSVGLSGTAAIVGAPRHFHSPNPQSGAAYIYEP